MATIGGIFDDIREERQKQDAEWGGAQHDDHHDGYDWAAFIVVHLGRAIAAGQKLDMATARRQFVRVAALAVAAIEWLDRKTARAGGQ